MKQIFVLGLTALSLMFSAQAHAAKVCPVAMIVFTDGHIADMQSQGIRPMISTLQRAIGNGYSLEPVGSIGELGEYDYAISLTIDKLNDNLFLKVRNVGFNKVLIETSYNYSTASSADDAMAKLAKKMNPAQFKKLVVCY